MGNPISHSWRHGFILPEMYVPFRIAAFLELLPPAFDEPLVGVGKKTDNPYSVSDMGGANVASLYTVPDRIIPERGQRSKDFVESSNKEVCDIFNDNVSGLYVANNSGIFKPESRAFPGQARFLSCLAKVLTWETSADCVNNNSV